MGPRCLQSTCYGQNYHDQKNQSDSSERIITPAGTVGPGRESTDQKKDENNKENCLHRGRAFVLESLQVNCGLGQLGQLLVRGPFLIQSLLQHFGALLVA